MESFRRIMDIVGTSMDGVGVLIVVGGSLFATVRLALRRMQGAGNYYVWYRQDVGRAILLGLEFLIAGDQMGLFLFRQCCSEAIGERHLML